MAKIQPPHPTQFLNSQGWDATYVTYVERKEGPGTEEGEKRERKMSGKGFASQRVTYARGVHLFMALLKWQSGFIPTSYLVFLHR